MSGNITRWLLAQLNRHLPRRLVQRDPLPNAKHLADVAIPPTLTAQCLRAAAMEKNELWRAFHSHPEGLNAGEVEKSRAGHGDNHLPSEAPTPRWRHLWLCYRNPFNLLLTALGIVSYATEDLFAAGVIALMVGISTLLNFVQEARSTKAADTSRTRRSERSSAIRRGKAVPDRH